MYTTRNTHRTSAGTVVPLAAVWMAAAFTFVAWWHRADSSWMGMDSFERSAAAGFVILGALATEWLVLRELKFIGSAEQTTATVDEVRRVSWSDKLAVADYHYFTQDGRVITARCAVPPEEAGKWQRGYSFTAIYDVNRPARHAVEGSTWAASGEIEAATSTMRLVVPASEEQSGHSEIRAAA